MSNSKLIGKINKIIKFSNVDGPGNRMAIFFQGCNFNCKYCHNPETINICCNCLICVNKCPTNALKVEDNKVNWEKELCCECDNCTKNCPNDSSPKVKNYTVDEIIDEIKKVKPFIKGITVSGGESSLHFEFITALFQNIKILYPDLTCFVDTNGGVDFSISKYKNFVDSTDAFMLDVKAWDSNEHLNMTNFSSENVIKNLIYLKEINKLFEVRTVIIKELLNNKLTVEEVSKIISGTNIRYKIIQYRHFGVRDEMKKYLISPTEEELKELEKIAKFYNVKNTLII